MNSSPKREVIALTGLCVHRGSSDILQKINWRVFADENWVLMGANGSGKTSLLSVLAGYLTPSAGTVRVCGKEYGSFPWQELRAMLGIVSTSVKRMIQPGFRALEIVASGKGALLNPWEEAATEDIARAAAIMEDAGVTYLAKREWELLSQGERQRILICRALMADPKLLILDEPCNGLDPVSRRKFLDFVEATANRAGGPPMIFVTHHVEEIAPVFTNALLIKQGRVLASGRLGDVITQELLGVAFGAPVKLTKSSSGRMRLEEFPD
jgi:iron complex transport system ATP-binding protein